MPVSLYESLVREYLENEGYLVYNNLKLPTKQEIDIFAFSPKKDAIIGEVKASNPNKKQMEEIASKFDRTSIEEFLYTNYGVRKFKFVFFCWNMYDKDESMREYGKEVGFDDVVTYPQVVRSLFAKVKEVRDNGKWFYDINRPNTLLLEIIHDAILHESLYLSKKDFEE